MGEFVENNIPSLPRIGCIAQNITPGKNNISGGPGLAASRLQPFADGAVGLTTGKGSQIAMRIHKNRSKFWIQVALTSEKQDAGEARNCQPNFIGNFEPCATFEWLFVEKYLDKCA